METKSPAFQWYPKDFLSDLNVIRMTTEEVGAYILLLSVCWIEGSLPNNIDDLALVAKMPIERFKISWEKRLEHLFNFVPEKDVFVHKRLEVEKRKQEKFREKKREAGRMSGVSRRKQRDLNAEQVLNKTRTEVEQNTNKNELSYLLSSSSTKDIKEKSISDEILQKKVKKPVSQKVSIPVFIPPKPRPEVEDDLWTEYLEYRTKILKKPVTERGYKMFLTDLEKLPSEFDLNRRITEAIERKWTGLIFKTDLTTEDNGNGKYQKPNAQFKTTSEIHAEHARIGRQQAINHELNAQLIEQELERRRIVAETQVREILGESQSNDHPIG